MSIPPGPRDSALTLDQIVAMLAPAVGREKSREAVAAAVASVGKFDADAVLNLLERDTGVVGIAARFSRSRERTPRKEVPKAGASAAPAAVRGPTAPQPTGEDGGAVRVQAIVDLLAPSLGEEASVSWVQAAKRHCGIEGDYVGRSAALKLLEALAAETGLVGIAARFAKARVIFLFGAQREPAP